MNEFKFEGYKNINTPESWIEKAVGIPKVQTKRRLPFKLSIIGTAASVVIVTAVILTLSVISGNKPIISNTPQAVIQVEETVPSTEVGSTSATQVEKHTTAQTTPSASANNQPALQSSEAVENRIIYAADQTEQTKPSDNTQSKKETEPANESEQKPTGTKPEESKPDEKTETEETQPESTQPTEQPLELPDDDDNIFSGNISIYFNSGNRFYYSKNAYIHITQNGTEFSKKYSDAERATVTAVGSSGDNNIKQAVLTPKDKGIYLNSNEPYTIEIYNDSGNSQTFNTYLRE